jgi:hypothetical protein
LTSATSLQRSASISFESMARMRSAVDKMHEYEPTQHRHANISHNASIRSEPAVRRLRGQLW